MRLQGAFFFFFFFNLSKKQMSSFYVCVPFCFILCKGSNKYLAACEKQSLWYLHRKCMPLLVWFSLCVVKGTFIFITKKEEERENAVQRSGADLCAWVFIALNLNCLQFCHPGNAWQYLETFFGCHN